MIVQDYIRENGLKRLQEDLKIKVTRHGSYQNLVGFKYNGIESPMGNPVVQACRGLILDEDNDWRVVCYPFQKFWNTSEFYAASIDWRTAKVYEKLDGSLICGYYYKNKWHVATTGSPDASGDVHGTGQTFSDLFWKTWEELDYSPPGDKHSTYMFELMTPDNRIVVPHSDRNIVLLGIRDNISLQESPPEVIQHWGVVWGWTHQGRPTWRVVNSCPLKTLDDVIGAARQLNPMQQEGFVVVDKNFNRVKVKSPQYVAIHHLKDQLTEHGILDIIKINEGSEFLVYFPEMHQLYNSLLERFNNKVQEAEDLYHKVSSIESRKDFALAIKDRKYASALFLMRDQKIQNIIEWFQVCDSKKLLEFI